MLLILLLLLDNVRLRLLMSELDCCFLKIYFFGYTGLRTFFFWNSIMGSETSHLSCLSISQLVGLSVGRSVKISEKLPCVLSYYWEVRRNSESLVLTFNQSIRSIWKTNDDISGEENIN